MNFRSFWNDRKWDGPLKVALEMELSRIKIPTRRGKTIEKYFADLHDYATTFALRKISFLDEFERKNGITFSERYRRKYLATCFDSYCEDLQKVVFGFLEVIYPFILFDSRDKKSEVELAEVCSKRFEEVFERWFLEPLRTYMEVILRDPVWSTEHSRKFRRMHDDICRSIRKKGIREIRKFFSGLSEKELLDNAEKFKEFREKLRSEGFDC
ncbi:hypothetical protein [Thermodesulforhabdus norvegica]|uniref:Uncharacterized protein n=1 Tax=Thermodesulforhabdus norvegica TaxID=39841 RepID=A0A1I4UCN6_9BACT|nr:hypothetical protein [Thermodesulforhabdus norvegica]SFM86580.1 hypothetical protein SAMN05660836_01777 [Thermodesulforhabdus norvegica]